MSDDKMLNTKQRKFAVEYMLDFNATRAAIAAGYSQKTAYSIGHENLKKPEIRDFIKAQQQQQMDDHFLSQSAVVNELIRYAFRNRPNSYQEVSAREATQALMMLGKHIGMFWEKGSEDETCEWKVAMKAALAELNRERMNGTRK